jgi:hypothetical protein
MRAQIIGWTLPVAGKKSHAVLEEHGRIIGTACGTAPDERAPLVPRRDVTASETCARCASNDTWKDVS